MLHDLKSSWAHLLSLWKSESKWSAPTPVWIWTFAWKFHSTEIPERKYRLGLSGCWLHPGSSLWIKSHILCCHILEILTINYPSLQVVWGNHKFNLGSQPNYFLLKSTSFGTSKNNLYLLHPPLFFTMRSVDSSPEYIHLCYCDLLLIWKVLWVEHGRWWHKNLIKQAEAGGSFWVSGQYGLHI